MISISALLLTIQLSIFLSFPILRIIFLKRFFEDERLKKFFLYSFLVCNFILTISFLSHFLYSYFATALETLSTFQICESLKYSIEFISALSILFIFSPNFLQFLSVYVVLDILVIEFTHFSTSKQIQKKNKIKSLIFSFILGDIFILVAAALLIRRSKSFDFSIINDDILFKFILSNPYFRNLCILLLVGIIIKCSLFPFHNWKSEACSGNSEWLFLFLNIYILYSLYTLIGTPFIHIISLIRNYMIWFGLAIALFSVIVTIFLNEGLDIVYILQSSLIGFIFLSIGTGIYSAAFHQLSILPFVFSLLLILILVKKSNKKNEIQDSTKSTLINSLIIFISLIIALIPIIGVVPFSSILLTLTYSFYDTNLLAPIGLLSVGLLTLCLTFFICLIFLRRIWIEKNKMELNSIQKITIISLISMLILTCAFFPLFFLQDSFGQVLNILANDYLISIIPILVSYFVISVIYFVITKFFPNFNMKALNFFKPISEKIRSFYYFDYIFYASNWYWSKIMSPLMMWIYKVIIIRFLYQIITKNLFRFISNVGSVISTSLTDYLYPFVRKIIVNISKFFLKLEYVSLRNQLKFAAIFIFVILLTFVLYYLGGGIS